jgi:hypothetical protein
MSEIDFIVDESVPTGYVRLDDGRLVNVWTKHSSSLAILRRGKRAQGVCLDCPKPAVLGMSTCQRHREARAARARLRYARRSR